MARKRRKLTRKKSKRLFRKTASKTHRMNVPTGVRRGGTRL